jgi:xanthosine utilization system XapX-like protein
LIPVGKQVLAGSPLRAAWHAARSASHIFGELPGRHSQQLAHTSVAQSPETRS